MTERKNNLTEEELTRIASNEGKAILNLKQDKTNVSLFLREFGVKDGTALVPNYVVYHAYRKLWRPQGNKTSKIGLLRKLSEIYESKRKNHTRYYLLNEGVFNLSKEHINEAKEFDKRCRQNIKRKKEESIETKQSEISSITETI